eukprot:Pompholyxophrys_sp_v1_NODE_106_length_1954_cov_77.883623.p1 type:complete len:112 gc:universal NODE_106_length_1954_cov_77.883623:1839-1504(-)
MVLSSACTACRSVPRRCYISFSTLGGMTLSGHVDGSFRERGWLFQGTWMSLSGQVDGSFSASGCLLPCTWMGLAELTKRCLEQLHQIIPPSVWNAMLILVTDSCSYRTIQM